MWGAILVPLLPQREGPGGQTKLPPHSSGQAFINSVLRLGFCNTQSFEETGDSPSFFSQPTDRSPYFPSQRKVSLSIQHLYYLSLPLSQVDQERECIFSIGFMVAKCNSRVCWYITYEGISLGRNHLIAKLKKVYLGRWNKVTFDIGNVESLNKWDH